MSAPLHASDGAGANGTSLSHSSQSYFHSQRALLVNEIAAVRYPPLPSLLSPFTLLIPRQALDSTLTHLNRLNRSLESVIGIGNEFSNVEALWSQFEGVMGANSSGSGATGVGSAGGAEGGGKAEDGEQEERESALETPPVARTGLGGSGEKGR